MKKVMTTTILLFSTLAWGSFKKCDYSRDRATKFNGGVHASHEFSAVNRTLLIGGTGGEYPKDIDHLAVQRSLISCGTGILNCFDKTTVKIPVKFKLSFQLNPKGEAATASDLQVHSLKSPEIQNCLLSTWSAAEFGLSLQKSVFISMPVEIR